MQNSAILSWTVEWHYNPTANRKGGTGGGGGGTLGPFAWHEPPFLAGRRRPCPLAAANPRSAGSPPGTWGSTLCSSGSPRSCQTPAAPRHLQTNEPLVICSCSAAYTPPPSSPAGVGFIHYTIVYSLGVQGDTGSAHTCITQAPRCLQVQIRRASTTYFGDCHRLEAGFKVSGAASPRSPPPPF